MEDLRHEIHHSYCVQDSVEYPEVLVKDDFI